MGRGLQGPRTTMARISIDLDDVLAGLALDLSTRLGRHVTKTEASQILAASQRPTLLVKKRREGFRIGGSLIWV